MSEYLKSNGWWSDGIRHGREWWAHPDFTDLSGITVDTVRATEIQERWDKELYTRDRVSDEA